MNVPVKRRNWPVAVAFAAGLLIASVYHRFDDTAVDSASNETASNTDTTERSSEAVAREGALQRGVLAFTEESAERIRRRAQARQATLNELVAARGVETPSTATFGSTGGEIPRTTRPGAGVLPARDSAMGALYGRIARLPVRLPACWNLEIAESHLAAAQSRDDSDQNQRMVIVSDPDTSARGRTSRVWQTIIPEDLRGLRLEISAELETRNVLGRAWLWVTADDSNGNAVAYDAMQFSFVDRAGRAEPALLPQDRRLTGTNEAARHSVVIDVPGTAWSLNYGFALQGDGALWIDDVVVMTTARDRPLTALPGSTLTQPPSLLPPLQELTPRSPVNTGFELVAAWQGPNVCRQLAEESPQRLRQRLTNSL